ncbi:hypothetical protein ACWGI1_04555 [Streptomyces sp. NPDC054835]
MEFLSDHTFRFTSVPLESDLYPTCPSGASTGKWNFFAGDGDTLIADPEAVSGESIALSFEGQALGGCNLSISVIDGGKSICLSDDPDSLCSVGPVFSRVESRS